MRLRAVVADVARDPMEMVSICEPKGRERPDTNFPSTYK